MVFSCYQIAKAYLNVEEKQISNDSQIQMHIKSSKVLKVNFFNKNDLLLYVSKIESFKWSSSPLEAVQLTPT